MSNLPKHFDPQAAEPRLYAMWESAGYFHEEPDPARPAFIICMPPPNVTARAHLGHGSTYTPMDVLVRYRRMLGDNADWLPGTDHAAIATETVLLRRLAEEGKTREDLGRKQYLDLAWSWSKETGGTIDGQFRALGFGPDWQRSRFTMDEGLSAAVQRVFIDLYDQGLIYRGKRLVNWDPTAKTTISDAEVEHEERDAHLWLIRYPAPDGGAGITVATTRPETMLGDVAIAVHPADGRYKHLVGTSVLLPPLLQREIPVLADDSVESEFGTGAVKVTPAHDPTDYEIGQRHGLPMPSVLDFDACVTGAEIDVGKYSGMDRYQARAAIVADLREAGLLVEERAYRHAVAISHRTGDVIEPLLSLQWFVRMKPLAEPALQAQRDGRVRFVPERYGRTYEQWLENIRDWNISRQVWWGHQLPVWYTGEGDIVVAQSEVEAMGKAQELYDTMDLTRDPDTLDTWFSSGLWPFSILGWPEQTPELAHWYPSQVLVTGGDIIFLWVARMMMLGLHFMDEVPFRDVFVTPTVYDAVGRKMSKSLGNAIDPMLLAQEYGADAFRMGMMRQMRLESQELRFQESRCEEARNFNNKIWNATRYLLALPEGLPPAMTLPKPQELTLADRWILTRLHTASVEATQALDRYDMGAVAETLWNFVWYELCDWYVEATKDPSARATRAAVLSFVLNNAMRLLHPLEPFITEEVWQNIPHDGQSIMTAAWPDPAEIPADAAAATDFAALQRTIERLRNLRAGMGLQPKERLTLRLPAGMPAAAASLLATLSGGDLGTEQALREPDSAAPDLPALLERVEAQAPRGVLEERYKKEADRLRAEVSRGEAKLANEKFVANAKPGVVANEREKLEGYRAQLARVQAALEEMTVG